MIILIREFSTPDEEMKKIVLKATSTFWFSKQKPYENASFSLLHMSTRPISMQKCRW